MDQVLGKLFLKNVIFDSCDVELIRKMDFWKVTKFDSFYD